MKKKNRLQGLLPELLCVSGGLTITILLFSWATNLNYGFLFAQDKRERLAGRAARGHRAFLA